eukprot:TRINITY_DN5692_c0_g1_i3.p1 TRINITY_DN5692_c0_g1~~TRINITY_DN5692_c0_g1_i3.p1  ORF type:complete len:314 (+),score=143.50 TRINITY_DN5692_c0_g1_i3:627-1568(+)
MLSRFGLIAFASSLDTPGIFTRSVTDTTLVYDSMVGRDFNDSTSIDANENCSNSFDHLELFKSKYKKGSGLKGVKIGIPIEFNVEELSNTMRELWQYGIDLLEQEGAEIVSVSLPHTKYSLATYYIIAPAEASSNLNRYDGIKYGHKVQTKKVLTLNEFYQQSRSEGFGTEVQRRILMGNFCLSRDSFDNYYGKAQKMRMLIKQDYQRIFDSGISFILTPTTPTPPFLISKQSSNPTEEYLNDVYTVPISLAGLPAISLPIKRSFENFEGQSGLPLSLQLISRWRQENNLLNVAWCLEQNANMQQLKLEEIEF